MRRVIAHRYAPQGDDQQVVIFFGLVGLVMNLVGSSISDWLIQTGAIRDWWLIMRIWNAINKSLSELNVVRHWF
jgi:hypothetical protein